MRRKLPLSKLCIIRWIPLGFVITILSGLIYTVVQQDIRLGSNEMPLQLASDTSIGLLGNQSPDTLIPRQNVDFSRSTAPFVIIYDESGKVISSSVISTFKTPIPPAGVFQYARMHDDDRITWEPLPGVRLATVVIHYQSKSVSGFVLAGRNMRDVEKNETIILELTFLAWLVAMVGSLGLMIVTEEIYHRGSRSTS